MKNLEDKVLLYAPIEKTDEELHMVYGYASTEAVDSQGEIVKKDALKDALADYMKFANIREMHTNSAVGKAKNAQIDSKGMYISAKIVDPTAWAKVKEGVYSGFSIGGHVKTMIGNEITALRLSEISLVDRPANPEAVFDVFKADQLNIKDMKKEDIIEELPEAKDIVVDEKEEVVEVAEVEAPVAEEVKEEVEEKVEEKSDKPELKKSLYHVADLACLIDQVHRLEEGIEVEGQIERDPKNVEHANKVNEAIKVLSDLLVDMAQTETKEVQVEEVNEVKEDTPVMAMADDRETLLKSIDDNIQSGLMPDEAQIDKLFEIEGIEKNERSVGVFKNTMANKIIEVIELNMQDQDEKDFAKSQMDKIIEKAEIIVAKSEKETTEFDKILSLIDDLAKGTTAEAPTLPEAESPRYLGSGENEIFARMVELLNAFNAGGALTEEEKKLLSDGLSEMSMRVSGGKFKTPIKDITQELHPKSDMPELKKMESEIEFLKGEIKKLNDMPEAIKVKASYSVIEKSEVVEDELAKALKEVDVMQEQLRLNPNDPMIISKAKDLSLKVMRLQRNQG